MKLVLAILVAACSTAAPPPPAPVPAAPAFQPTAFGVTVAGQGRPVILIPGLACPPSIWDGTVAHLGSSVQTHVLTLSGFAGRPPIAGPLVATAREELARYIRDRHLDHPIVIGHSLGGTLAVWLAATEPALVGPVIDVDGFPPVGAPADVLEGAKTTRERWKAATPEQFAQGARMMFGGMTNDPAALEPVIQGILRSDQRAVADAYYELFTLDARAALPKVTAPLLALLAEGPYRELITSELGPIKDHEVVVVPNAKHMIMADAPDAFFHAVDGFLAKHAR